MSDSRSYGYEVEQRLAEDRAKARREQVVVRWTNTHGLPAAVAQLETYRDELRRLLQDDSVSLPQRYWKMIQEMKQGLDTMVKS